MFQRTQPKCKSFSNIVCSWNWSDIYVYIFLLIVIRILSLLWLVEINKKNNKKKTVETRALRITIPQQYEHTHRSMFFFLCVRNCEQWTEVVYSLRASYEVVANIHRNAEWTWKMLVFFLLLVLLFIIRENWSRPITINFSSCVPFLTKCFCETKKKWIQSIKVNIQKWEEKNKPQAKIYILPKLKNTHKHTRIVCGRKFHDDNFMFFYYDFEN